MIQRLVEVLAQQTCILGFVELACADYWRRNWMSRNEAANRCPDGAVVGGDPAVIAIQKGVNRLPSVVDAAGKIWRFLNPQSNPQKVMSCTTCVYLGSLHALISRCKT